MMSPEKNSPSFRSIVRDMIKWDTIVHYIIHMYTRFMYDLGQFWKVSVFIWNPANEADTDVNNESLNTMERFSDL